jgi:SAM-dependent methyltransferase
MPTINNITPSTSCPLCGSLDKTLLVNYESDAPLKHLKIPPSSLGYKSLKNQIMERWGGDNCSFVECNNCHFNYADPFVAGTDELYSFFYNEPNQEGRLKWEHKLATDIILKKIKENNLKAQKLLEFGPGDGSFVKNMVNQGIKPENIVCIESSENYIKALNDSGIRCFSSSLSSIDTEEFKNKFDVVAMFQVLEHLDNIDEIFKFINKIIAPNGSVFIAVPNNYIRRFYELNDIFIDVPPVHISRWSEQNFEMLAEKYGWKIKNYEVEKISSLESGYNFVFYKGFNQSYSKIKNKVKSKLIRWPLLGVKITSMFLTNIFKIKKIKSNTNGTSQMVHLEKI